MSALSPTLPKQTAKKLLANDRSYTGVPSSTIRGISHDQELYRMVESILENRLLDTAHTFQLKSIETVSADKTKSRAFKQQMEAKQDSQIRFLFHGTTEMNHCSIFDKGFLIDEEHFGDTDAGYIGKGVYLTPGPEYSASYIKGTPGITRYRYGEPVAAGVTFKVLGCVAIVGATKQLEEKEVGITIPTTLDSHWAYVDREGNATGDHRKRFDEEYAIREPAGIYPRFRFTLKRVAREVIWVDPNITNSENSGHVRRLKSMEDIFVYATSSVEKALQALKKKKSGTEYRAITAGRGGEDFVQKLRGDGVTCKVLVFCGTVKYHKPWAAKLDTAVTASTQTMYSFASWSN